MSEVNKENAMGERIYTPLGQELMEGLNDLRSSQALLDVTVIVGNKPFKAHRAVLASLSGYFQVMFTNQGFIDMKQSEIEIKEDGLSSDSFSQLLDFMYTSKIHMTSVCNILDLLQAAGFFQVKGAIQLCVEYLKDVVQKQDIAFEVALDVSCTANTLDHPDLKNFVDRYVGQNMVKFVRTSEFLEQMTAGYLEELLQREDLNETTSEEELLEVVIAWLQFDWDARKNDTCALLKHIRFGVIPNHVVSDILGAEIEDIAKEIIDKEDELSSTHRGATIIMFGDIKAAFQVVKVDQDRQGFRDTTIHDMQDDNVKTKVLSNVLIERRAIYPMSDACTVRSRYYWGSDDDEIPDEEDMVPNYEDATHKVLTNLPLFQVTRQEAVESNGWHLAGYSAVKSCLNIVKPHLGAGRDWYICSLNGGKVSGCGYRYEMDHGDHHTLGHKLLMRYPQEFSVIPTKKILSEWKVATVDEVKSGFILVKKLLRGKKSGYVCLLQGGTVSGEDKYFQLKETEANAFTLADHQIVVKINR